MVSAGLPIRDLVDRYLAPIMRATGEDWLDAKLTAGDEHLRTVAAERALSGAADAAPARQVRQGVLLVGGVAGDQHTLPPRMLAEVLQEDGWDVRQLGTGLPPDEIRALVEASGAQAVLLGCSILGAVPAVVETVAALRVTGVSIFAGGAGLGPDAGLARAAGADGWAPDAEGVLRLLRHPPPPAPVSEAAERLPAYRAVAARLAQLTPEILRRLDAPSLVASAVLPHLEAASIAQLLGEPAPVIDHLGWTRRYLASRGVAAEEWVRALEIATDVIDRSGSAMNLGHWLTVTAECPRWKGPTWAG